MDNWLITILALVVMLALGDGVRRAILRHREAQQTARRFDRALHGEPDTGADSPELEEGNWVDPEEAARQAEIARELPGSVRVVQRRALEEALQVNRRLQEGSRRPAAPRTVGNPAAAGNVSRPAPGDELPGEQPAEQQDEQTGELMSEHKDMHKEQDKHLDNDPERQLEKAQRGFTAEPQQASLNLEEQVPTLMESVAEGGDDFRREPELDEAASLQALSDTEQEEQVDPVLKDNRPPRPQTGQAPDTRVASDDSPRRTSKAGVRGERGRARPDRGDAGGADKSPVEEVLIINIMAREGDLFEGNDLLRALMASSMRFGDMDIFHYHLGGGDDGPVVFSLANMVVPGVFDLGRMEEFTTPGVSLFLALPIDGEAIRAFELMLSVAREVAEQLGGELKDENRSVFTAQTAEHYRQRVIEHQRRRALARAQA